MLLYDSVEINNIVYDSRKATPDSVFVCMRGAVTDGHKYAVDAYAKGCRIFVCEEKLTFPHDDAVQFIKSDTRLELAKLSAQLFGNPAEKLKIIGITGTKGKTSTAMFIYNTFKRAGKRAGLICTNGIYYNDIHINTVNSTPESYELHKNFAEMLELGIEYVVMEVSSQAYKMNRVYGIEFEIGMFTNLSSDHIGEGEHDDFDEYRLYKSKLFEHSVYSVINTDDENSGFIISNVKKNLVTFGMSNADYTADHIELWQTSDIFGVKFYYNEREFVIRTPGVYNVYNALGAIAVCDILNIDLSYLYESLANDIVSGRFTVVNALDYAKFIIDYAHNEFSLRNVLETIKQYDHKRLICLFGSVGGRTKLRRGGLGKIAGELCDFCILTSDNPDYENPLNIIEDIERGLLTNSDPCPYIVIPDRREAIEYAVKHAAEGDVILLAGKGHEDYQLIEGEHVPFNEKEIIIEAAESIVSYH